MGQRDAVDRDRSPVGQSAFENGAQLGKKTRSVIGVPARRQETWQTAPTVHALTVEKGSQLRAEDRGVTTPVQKVLQGGAQVSAASGNRSFEFWLLAQACHELAHCSPSHHFHWHDSYHLEEGYKDVSKFYLNYLI